MMATVIFYEKPGCGNNTKQKVWLAASGHTVLAKNLLTEKWTASRLRPLQKDELVTELKSAGFADIKTFGNMTGAAFDPAASPNLVILAKAS